MLEGYGGGLLLALWAAVAGPAPVSDVAGWGRAIEQASLGGAGVAVAGRTIRIGQLEITLVEGRLVPVRALDRTVGAWFSGRGRLRYRCEEPLEAAVWPGNLERTTSYRAGEDGAVQDDLDSVLLWFSPGGEALVEAPAWLEGEASPAVRAAFAAHREKRREERGWRAEWALPPLLVEAPREPFVLAEIDAARHDLVHVRDTRFSHDEVLLRSRPVEDAHPLFKDVRLQSLLSEQPIGRKRLDPRPLRFRLVELDGTLVNPGGLRAEVEVREVIEAVVPVATLDFRLMSDLAGGQGVLGNLKRNAFTLAGVTDGEGRPLAFWHRHDSLSVELREPLRAGERAELRLAISGDVLFRPDNDDYWNVASSWFPALPVEAQAFSYRAIVKVARPLLPFSSGRLVRRWEEGELACAEFQAPGPIQQPALLAGKYTTYEEKRDGLTVRVSTYGLDKPEAKKRLAGIVFGLVEFYRPLLGDYPWGELDVIEINRYGFGIAPPGVIYITREAFVPAKLDPLVTFVVRGVNERLAHEVAHAWWGNATMLGGADENWLWEATAEYFAAFAMGHLKGKREFDRALGTWRAEAKEAAGKAPIYPANQLSGDDAARRRTQLLYNKGPAVPHALRAEVGDETFFTILKSFQRNFRGKPAYTRDFIALASFVARRDLGPFFHRYVLGMEMPPAPDR